MELNKLLGMRTTWDTFNTDFHYTHELYSNAWRNI